MLKKLLIKILGRNQQKDSTSKMLNPSKEVQPLSTSLDDNLQTLQKTMENCADIVFRQFIVPSPLNNVKAFIVYVEGLCDPKSISADLLKPLLNDYKELESSSLDPASLHEVMLEQVLSLTDAQTTTNMLELVETILNGNVALILDASATAIIASLQQMEGRPISEPDTEPIVRGPKDGFVESLDINASLIRRRIRSSRLKVEYFKVGSLTKTRIAVTYIQGLANEKVIEEVRRRLKRINIDGILASGYIEELIGDEPFTMFPLINSTERPDRASASLLEGRVVILVDNTPLSLIVPCTFVSLLQAAEDYYNLSIFATFVRIIRFIALNIALLLPAFTVAFFSFHQELIPTTFLTNVASARQDLPMPIAAEVLLMEITFELLREAGIRLPKAIGQAISTVGGLVIGQAAVNAGYVAPIPVIVVAMTAIASFTIPSYPAGISIRILRFFLLVCASIMGGVGIILGLMAILVHLCSLRSFGVPYLSPFAPLSPTDLKDTFIRVPWWAMLTRPRLIGNKEPIREDNAQGPTKPDKRGKES